jgi:signal transduction histidine kinase
MTIIANTQFPNLIPPNLEFTPLSTDSLFPTLGTELIYTQDSSGRYLHFHWAHSAYLGCDTERIVDFLNENDSFAPVDKFVYLEHLHRILSSSVPERVKCWFKCNIELFELELTITPILPRFGQPITTVLVMGRLLPSKINPQAELELAEEVAEQIGTAIAHANLYKVVEEYQQKAEAAERLKSEFLANVSHEIRTPLNGIIGLLQLILAGMTDHPEEQNEFITEAHELSLHLLNILNNILDAATIETGKIELDFSPVNLNKLFEHIESLTRPQAEIKNLSFYVEMPIISDKILVQGNYQRLLQVMLNLVGNAIKFTHQGGITVSADLIANKHPAVVKVTVADTGIGVSPDNQDKLFQLFSQVDGSRTRQYGGTGLGLVISQRLIQAMGGEVHFYSLGEGFGSTVTFTIPVY